MGLFEATHYQTMEEKLLLRILGEHHGKTLLDVGCGHGKYLELAQRTGLAVVGVDVNPEQLLALRNKGFDVCLPDELEPSRQFDLLLLSHVIEHLQPKELTDFLDNYLPRLPIGGLAIIISPLLGARFYYDPTHVRPYYPQSLRMLMGGIAAPSSMKTRHKADLENIFFFRDAWRLRENRWFYPVPGSASSIAGKMVRIANLCLAGLHWISGGRLGVRAGWLGLYRRTV